MLLFVTALKLLAEIALMALLGRWILGLLAGAKREHNVFYKLFDVITSPFFKLTRRLVPRRVDDRYLPVAAFFLLSVLWIFFTAVKIKLCLQSGINTCR